MALGKVALFLREAESEAVRRAFAPRGGPGDSDGELASHSPLPADALLNALEADPTAFQLDGRMVFLSLYSALAPEDGRFAELHALDGLKERWLSLLVRLRAVATRTYVLNVFRHVREPRAEDTFRDGSGLRATIRHINLIGDELTSRGDAALVDVDRALASTGGRLLQADFRWPEDPNAERAIAAATTAVAEAVNTFPPERR